MFGLEAISHHNGWVVAATGASIVFAGLAVLASIISQLHKFVALLEQPQRISLNAVEETSAQIAMQKPNPCAALDLNQLELTYKPLFDELGPEFQMAELYIEARKYRLPHPHLSIRCLTEAGKLELLGEGLVRYRP